MENFVPRPRRVIRIPLKKTIVVLIIIGAVLWFFSAATYRGGIGLMSPSMGIPTPPSGVMQESSMTIAPDSYPYRGGQGDIADTREFLKISYSATLFTRDVPDTVRDVKGVIREYEGRIDSENTAERYGHVSFVVPKSRFESFRTEIESLTHEKLYIERVSSQNLLREKQDIEAEMNLATTSLAALNAGKADLDASHRAVLASLQNSLASLQKQYADIQVSVGSATDEEARAAMNENLEWLSAKIAGLEQELSAENSAYYKKAEQYKAAILRAEGKVEHVETKDENFLNNVETVTGTIQVNWISVWGLAERFSPIYPTYVIVILVLLAWYVLARKGVTPKVEFV